MIWLEENSRMESSGDWALTCPGKAQATAMTSKSASHENCVRVGLAAITREEWRAATVGRFRQCILEDIRFSHGDGNIGKIYHQTLWSNHSNAAVWPHLFAVQITGGAGPLCGETLGGKPGGAVAFRVNYFFAFPERP